MKTRRYLFGLTLFMVVVGAVACGGREKETADAPEAVQEQAAPEQAAPEQAAPEQAGQEQSVVAHDSTTHGALQVRSIRDNPTDWFQVLQDGKSVLPGNPKHLNGTVELAPGIYDVQINLTQRTVTIEAGKKTVLWTGELIVEGGPAGAFWYPMEGTERKLSSNPPLLNAPRDFFSGSYTVFVHVGVGTPEKNLGTAEVLTGKRTVLRN